MLDRLTQNCNVQSKRDFSLFGTLIAIDITDKGNTYSVLWDGYDEPVKELASNLQVLECEEDVLHSTRRLKN